VIDEDYQNNSNVPKCGHELLMHITLEVDSYLDSHQGEKLGNINVMLDELLHAALYYIF
jgi:hypothetical protein